MMNLAKVIGINGEEIMQKIIKSLMNQKTITESYLPCLYILLPLLFFASFSLAISKSYSLSFAKSTAAKIGTIIIMTAIALACIVAAFFFGVLLAKKEQPLETIANGTKFLGFIASIVGCIELCILVGDDLFKIHSLDKHIDISTGLSISASVCFVLATSLLTAGMWFYAYAKALEKENKYISNKVRAAFSDKLFILFIFQIVGACAFLIQSFYGNIIPNAETSLIHLNQYDVAWNGLAKMFFVLGAVSAFILFSDGINDYCGKNNEYVEAPLIQQLEQNSQ